jgi:hypothetical protein
MKKLKHLFVPNWTRFLPGFLFCVVFAFLGMNLDRLIGNYHKANDASLQIPALEQQLQDMITSGADSAALDVARTAIEQQRKSLNKVHGTVGQQWGWAWQWCC